MGTTIRYLRFIAPLLAIAGSSVVEAQQQLPPDFRNCLQQQGCTYNLSPGTYWVPSTLLVTANTVTIRGTGTSPGSTILRRQYASPAYPMMRVQSYGVTIQNLEFDGNRSIFPNVMQQIDANGPYWWTGMPGYYGCPAGNMQLPGSFDNYLYDLEVVGGQTTVNNVYFFYAPGDGVGLSSALGNSVWYSFVFAARSTGIRLHGSSIAAYSSVSSSGTAGIAVWDGSGATVTGNTLSINRFEMSDGHPGGSLFTDPSSQSASISENVVDGGNWYFPGGTWGVNGCYGMGGNQYPNSPAEYPTGVEARSVMPYGVGNRWYNNEIRHNTGGGVGIAGSNLTYWSGNDPFCPWCAQKFVEYNTTPTGNPQWARGIWVNDTNTSITLDNIRSCHNSGDAVNVQGTANGPGYTGTAMLQAPNYPPYWPSAVPGFINPTPSWTLCP